MSEINKICMGIDVSKDTLDIFWNNRSYKISNNSASISNFIKTTILCEKSHVFCALESTGGYERLVKRIFQKNDIIVHTAHPNRVHAFAKALGHFAKTDKLDAILLHEYASFKKDTTKGDMEQDPVQQEIFSLRRVASKLEESLHAAQCKVKQMEKVCTKYLLREIKFYKKQILEIHGEIDNKIKEHEHLKEKSKIMQSMKGVGEKIASILIAELPELGLLSKRKIAKLVGVAPRTFQSGKRESKGHIFGGRFYVRKALYMAALVAVRVDKNAESKYKKFIERGKAKKVALVAIMRDIIISLNAMVRKMEKYQICD